MSTPASNHAPIRLAVIVGSTREGRFGPTVANWFVDHASQRGDLDIDVVDLADFELPSQFGQAGSEAMAPFRERIGLADAFAVVTPEYNHGYPASLKQAIDFVNVEWHAKPVGFVSYGGISGGLRAVEQLRLVFAELHAVTIRDGVSLHDGWNLFDEAGSMHEPENPLIAVKMMLDELTWFARALRTARAERPYDSLAVA